MAVNIDFAPVPEVDIGAKLTSDQRHRLPSSRSLARHVYQSIISLRFSWHATIEQLKTQEMATQRLIKTFALSPEDPAGE
jgi:hypothetical protein